MKRPFKRTIWTSGQLRKLKALAKRKRPARDIAKTLRRTENATRQKACSLGLSLNYACEKRAFYALMPAGVIGSTPANKPRPASQPSQPAAPQLADRRLIFYWGRRTEVAVAGMTISGVWPLLSAA